MIINASDLDTSPPEYTVEGWVPRIGVGFGYGRSTIGKTLVWGIDMPLAIATGTKFFGLDVVQGNVALCLGEGQQDAGVRKEGRTVREQNDRLARAGQIATADGPDAARAWLDSLPPYTDERLFIMPHSFAVPIRADMTPTSELRRGVNELRQVPNLEMVVLDAAADFGGMSLANDTSANRFMLGLRWMAAELDCVVFVIAHPVDKGGHKTGLPGSRLFNSSDFVFTIEPDLENTGGVTTATIIAEKVKSGPLPDPLNYTIEPVYWYEPARDPETRELVPGAPPVLTSSATARQRNDELAGTGGLRLPGTTPRPAAEVPAAVPAPDKPRKRSGIRPGAGFRVVSPAVQPEPAPDPETAALLAEKRALVDALISGDCPSCAHTAGRSCIPSTDPGGSFMVLTRPPESEYMVIAHTTRVLDRVAAGVADLDDVLAQFAIGAEPAELAGLASVPA
jgi:AAA domain-containing protein